MLIEELNSNLLYGKLQDVKSPSRCPFMQADYEVKLKNFTTGKQTTDKLHSGSTPIKCSGSSCKGALMSGQSSVPGQRSKEEVLEEAIKFQEEYAASLKKSSPEVLHNRLNEIKEEISKTGTYFLTYEELVFGAKLAWRNASRCIGRIQWNRLEVSDCRNITSTQEMFEALCKHLEYATNGGNIRSMITIFPQTIPGREDFRLWNPQLLSFAGYLQPDGTVIGDPGKLQFTRICQRLGWKGPGGRFDILPWIFSAPGEGVKLYEIPKELVLTVKIEHPKYSWFSELELEWYAVPAVADMMLDAGGVAFTAAPFNGWYMATEIGARNFCDEQRYNISKEVAQKLGLDTSTPTSLWKDTALIETTLAVLYSFQKNKVTIVDHHSAAESFMKHIETEQTLRGGCPADWVWIVPPVSGSITPVFHQEMINYNLKPSYEYQEKAWISHKWPQRNKANIKYSFSSIGAAVVMCVHLMSKVRCRRTEVTIVYATETGKSETYAKKLGRLLHSSFNTKVLCMDGYDLNSLTSESFIIVVTSTFGSGEPPDNGKDFWTSLKRMKENGLSLTNVRYAVFALGSSQYPNFCNFGKNVDKLLSELGGKKLMPVALGDELKGQEHSFNTWLPQIYQASCEEFRLEVPAEIETPISSASTWKPGHFRITATDSKEKNVLTELSRLHNKKLFPMTVLSRARLQASYSDHQTLLVRLDAGNTTLSYEPGDHVAIFPTNSQYIVKSILEKIENNETAFDEVVQIEQLEGSSWQKYDRLQPASLRTYLSRYLDITTPPSPSFLLQLSMIAKNPWDKYRLKRLSEVADDYEEWKSFRYPHLGELLEEFPSARLDPTLLISELPLLQPRFYSISSSRRTTPKEIHLTLSLLSYRTQDDKGPWHHGVCTSFLNSLPDVEVPCFIRSAPRFRLPEDHSLDVIMIGAGSGIAPFRSFWQEREALFRNHKSVNGNSSTTPPFGSMFLFFGCRQSTVDNIYNQETAPLVRKDVINKVFTALSREPGQPKEYVQDKLEKESALVLEVLSRGGHIYVCGDAVMSEGVRNAINTILKNGGKDFDVEKLVENERYHEDIFGVLHKR